MSKQDPFERVTNIFNGTNEQQQLRIRSVELALEHRGPQGSTEALVKDAQTIYEYLTKQAEK